MAIHKINNPVGIDIAIQRLQNDLYYDLGWSNIEVYARIYKGEKDGKYLPQPYLNNGEYLKDVFLNDKNNAHIFFDVDDQHIKLQGPVFNSNVNIIFMVNLNRLFPNKSHRCDVECQQEAWGIVSKRKDFKITRIETELKNVFKDYDLSAIKKLDIQPYHVFAIKTNLRYHVNSKH